MFHELTAVENLDLDKHYWDQACLKDLTVDGKIFYTTGDMFTTPLAATFIMLFNKKLQQANDLPDFYEMVREKKWTIDYLSSLVNEYGYQDNGDSTVGVDDTFGMGIQDEVYFALYYSMGGRLTNKDDADMPSIAFDTQRAVQLIDKIYALTRTGDNVIDAHEWLGVTGTERFASVDAFFDGRCIFFSSNASNMGNFREMEDDFGVLPMPLVDENQKDYKSFIYSGANLVAIPTMNTKDVAFTGFVLEAIAAESYIRVTPAYYTTTLKGKYQRDEDSYEMLDIACRNRVWDLGYICSFGNIYTEFTKQIKAGSGSYSSFLRRIERPFQYDLNEYIKAYEKSDK